MTSLPVPGSPAENGKAWRLYRCVRRPCRRTLYTTDSGPHNCFGFGWSHGFMERVA